MGKLVIEMDPKMSIRIGKIVIYLTPRSRYILADGTRKSGSMPSRVRVAIEAPLDIDVQREYYGQEEAYQVRARINQSNT